MSLDEPIEPVPGQPVHAPTGAATLAAIPPSAHPPRPANRSIINGLGKGRLPRQRDRAVEEGQNHRVRGGWLVIPLRQDIFGAVIR